MTRSVDNQDLEISEFTEKLHKGILVLNFEAIHFKILRIGCHQLVNEWDILCRHWGLLSWKLSLYS